MAKANLANALRAGAQGSLSFADALSKMGKEQEDRRLRELQEELLGLNISKGKADAANDVLVRGDEALTREETAKQRTAGTDAVALSERILGGTNDANLGPMRAPTGAPDSLIQVPGQSGGFNTSMEDMLARQATKAAQAKGEQRVFTPEEFRLKREGDAIQAKLGPLQLRKAEAEVKAAETKPSPADWKPFQSADGTMYRMDSKSGKVEPVTGADGQPLRAPSKDEATGADILVPGLKPIAGTKITKDSVKKVKAAKANFDELVNQINTYRSLYESTGTELVGEDADRLEAMATGMQLTLKELQNLGVLNGPDLMLMLKQIPSAAGFGATMKSAAYGMAGQDPILPKLAELERFAKNRFKSSITPQGFELEDAPNADYGNPGAALDAVYGNGADISTFLQGYKGKGGRQ